MDIPFLISSSIGRSTAPSEVLLYKCFVMADILFVCYLSLYTRFDHNKKTKKSLIPRREVFHIVSGGSEYHSEMRL